MPVVPCVRPSQGSVQSPRKERRRALQFLGRGLHQQPDFPVAGVIAQSDRRAVGRANAAMGTEDEELLAAKLAGSQPMPTF